MRKSFRVGFVASITAMLLCLSTLPAAAASVWDSRTMELCSPYTGVESHTYGGSVYTANHRLYYTEARSINQARIYRFFTTSPAYRNSKWSDYQTFGSSAYGYYNAYSVERYCSY